MNRSWVGLAFCVVLVGGVCLGDGKTDEEREAEKAKKKAEKEKKKAEKEEKKKLAALYGKLNVAVAKYLDDCNNVCKAWDSGYDLTTFRKYLYDRVESEKKVREAAAAIPEGDPRVPKLLEFCEECSVLFRKASGPGDVVLADDDKAKLKALRKKLKTWRPALDPPKKRFAE